MVERQTYTAMPAFTGRNVPVTEIAKAMHKDAQYVELACSRARSSLAMQSSWKARTNTTITALTARFGKKSAISMPKEKLNNKKSAYPCRGKRSR